MARGKGARDARLELPDGVHRVDGRQVLLHQRRKGRETARLGIDAEQEPRCRRLVHAAIEEESPLVLGCLAPSRFCARQSELHTWLAALTEILGSSFGIGIGTHVEANNGTQTLNLLARIQEARQVAKVLGHGPRRALLAFVFVIGLEERSSRRNVLGNRFLRQDVLAGTQSGLDEFRLLENRQRNDDGLNIAACKKFRVRPAVDGIVRVNVDTGFQRFA